MEVIELTDKELLGILRAEYQRMETRLHNAERKLATLLWCNGPMDVPASTASIPKDLRVTERLRGGKVRLSAVMLSQRVSQ